MQYIWKFYYQLVSPNLHCRNAAKRAICTFKEYFLSILAGIAEDFPKNLWDLLIPKMEMTLNILRQSTLKPDTLAWEHFYGPISYNHAPLGTLGCKFIMHKKPYARPSWDFHLKYGWNVCVSLDHYWCS